MVIEMKKFIDDWNKFLNESNVKFKDIEEEVIEALKKYLSGDKSEDKTLEDMAKRFGMNRRTLSTIQKNNNLVKSNYKRANLTDEEKEDIINSDLGPKELAKKYGVSVNLIALIRRKERGYSLKRGERSPRTKARKINNIEVDDELREKSFKVFEKEEELLNKLSEKNKKLFDIVVWNSWKTGISKDKSKKLYSLYKKSK